MPHSQPHDAKPPHRCATRETPSSKPATAHELEPGASRLCHHLRRNTIASIHFQNARHAIPQPGQSRKVSLDKGFNRFNTS
jgi:hypothetical protein